MATRRDDYSDGRASGKVADRIAGADPRSSTAVEIDVLMLNVGLACDLACAVCHHGSSPRRDESMSRGTMHDALELASILRPSRLDVTGGEPTLWEHLPELVEGAGVRAIALQVRTNAAGLARPQRAHLTELFARHGVAILASLHGFDPSQTGPSSSSPPEDVLSGLRVLSDLGYGRDPRKVLDIAYNPAPGHSPRPASLVAEEFRAVLEPLGIRFNDLRVIANVPVGRWESSLRAAGLYDAEIERLSAQFNPDVLGELTCRHGIEIAWDGTFSDCDFNLGAGMRVIDGPRTVGDALALAASGRDVAGLLASRRIAFGAHCLACTAGAGSG